MKRIIDVLVLSFFCLSSVRGSAPDHPMILLVSFDGFRWDYLKKFDLPNFNFLKSIGSHSEYINNSFATVTFPSKGRNNLTEPIWITNQKAGGGRKSAVEWEGAGVSFDNQSPFWIAYNNSRPYKKLIDEFVTLFTREKEPINFGAIYFDEPDHTAHIYGPYSKEIEAKLYSIDQILGYLINELKAKDLFNQLNLIITSDFEDEHDYNNNHASMFPIFISHGPNFKENFTIPSFEDVDIYPLMCYILGIRPRAHNGTLRNVIDMIVVGKIESDLTYVFVLLSLITASILISTAIFVSTKEKIKIPNQFAFESYSRNSNHNENLNSSSPLLI